VGQPGQDCVNKLCPTRTSLTTGEKNIVNPPLVLSVKIFLPPLHIKLGLMKNFVKGMDRTGSGFEYVRNKFPDVSGRYIYRTPDHGTDARQTVR